MWSFSNLDFGRTTLARYESSIEVYEAFSFDLAKSAR
jgi:hypothetical protein